MTKAFRALRMEDEKEDCSWALALDDSERLEIATRLVSDLWSAAHDGSPFPRMDRIVCSYIPRTRIAPDSRRGGGTAAVMNVRQTYAVSRLQKGPTP